MAKPTRRRVALTPRGGKTTVTLAGLARKTVYFSEDEWAAIRAAAYTRGEGYTDVIRAAVRKALGVPVTRRD